MVDTGKGPCFGQRHVQTVLLFFVIVVNNMIKYNAAVALVAMTTADSTNPDYDEYDWDAKQRSYILSSFFWGLVPANLIGGYLARRYGSKTTLLVVTLGSSVLSIVVPWCVPWGDWQIYCTIRIIQGIFQGPMFPCIYAHLAAWSPLLERNRLGALAISGIECANLLTMYVSGILAASPLGWPSVFYIPGVFGFVWAIFWIIWAADIPSKSKYISLEEREYIITSKKAISTPRISQQSNEATNIDYNKDILQNNQEIQPTQEVEIREIPVPWRAIMTSVPFIVLILTRCGEDWGFHTLQAQIPSYMFGVLNMDMTENAIFSAIPYLTSWIMSYVFLIGSDILIGRGWMSLTAMRRTFNSIAFYIPAIMLIGISYLDMDQRELAIVLMTLNVGINAGNTIGSSLNSIDLSPNHASILMSIVNTAANVMPLISPLTVGLIVTDEHDRSQWQIVFFISAIIFIVSNTIYIIFGSTDTQQWDNENFLLQKHEEGVGKTKQPSKPMMIEEKA